MRTVTLIILSLQFLNLSAQKSTKVKRLFKANSIEFSMPSGYYEVPVKKNPDLYYNFAIQHSDKLLEIRYSVFELAPLVKSYKKNLTDPDKTVVNPNKFHESMLMANLINLAQNEVGMMPESISLPEGVVNIEFNADYGTTSLFEAHSEFAEGYSHCFLLLLHKNDIADVYITFLTNHPDKLDTLLEQSFHALKFK